MSTILDYLAACFVGLGDLVAMDWLLGDDETE